jgi:uracil-DNA glycosylase family 4
MTTVEPTSTGEGNESLDSTRTRKHPDAACESCGLYDGRYAPGYGPDTASLVVVGEAPGYREAREGRPFIGPSGQLLDSVLSNYGVKREDVYVDNVCACRPADNRTPTPHEVTCCWPRARSEIRRRNPDTILALGNTAAQAILDTRAGITQVRVGPPRESEQFPGARVVPTFHPAACLRAADFFPHLVTDVGKALRPVHVGWEEPTVTVVDNAADGITALNELGNKYDEMSIDIEVGIDKELRFEHPDQFRMLCIGMGYKPGFSVVFGENCVNAEDFKWLLSQLLTDKKWIMQNGKFDTAGLLGHCGVEANLWFDTMLASYVLDERPGTHGLDYLGIEVLGTPDWKREITKYIDPKKDSYALIPRDVLYKYNGYDSAVTQLLKGHYVQTLEPIQRSLHDFLVEASIPWMYTEMEGIGVDIDYSSELVEKYLAVLEPLEKQLQPWVENPRSPQQVKAALAEMGFRVGSTDEDHLKTIQAKVSPESDTAEFIRLMLQHRREQKLYSTYVKGLRKRLRGDRVYSSFLLHGTTTGRLASRNPNLFNIVRDTAIKRQYIAGPGNAFVQGDYRTAELRWMTVEGSDTFLADIFREGRDIHDEFSLVFYGPGFTKDQRVRTKAFVYGLSYGRDPFSIAMEHGITVAQAKKYADQMFQMMPGVAAWRQSIIEQVLHGEDDLETQTGRRRRFWLITEENKKDVINQALAFKPQANVSDMCCAAFIKLRRDYGLATRVSVYDSILVECPADVANDVADLMRRVMEETAYEYFGDSVPFPVDITIGKSWGDV